MNSKTIYLQLREYLDGFPRVENSVKIAALYILASELAFECLKIQKQEELQQKQKDKESGGAGEERKYTDAQVKEAAKARGWNISIKEDGSIGVLKEKGGPWISYKKNEVNGLVSYLLYAPT